MDERLSNVKTDLQKIADSSSTQVDQLVKVVKEQDDIHKQMKESLMRDVLQDIMTAVFQVDRNHDFTMSKEEVQALLLRLQNFPGVIVNQSRFKEFTTTGADYQDDGKLKLSNVMAIARNIQATNIPEDQRVLRIDPKSLLGTPSSQQAQTPATQ